MPTLQFYSSKIDSIMTDLVIDAGLVIFLLLSTIIGNFIVSNFWRGLIGLQSLSFSTMNTIGIYGVIFMVIPSFSPVIISSYFYGNIAYAINHKFDYSDIILVSTCCFLGMFIIMGGDRILGDLENMDRSGNMEYYHHLYLWWQRLDESLTPAVIITLLIMSGLLISFHFNDFSKIVGSALPTNTL